MHSHDCTPIQPQHAMHTAIECNSLSIIFKGNPTSSPSKEGRKAIASTLPNDATAVPKLAVNECPQYLFHCRYCASSQIWTRVVLNCARNLILSYSFNVNFADDGPSERVRRRIQCPPKHQKNLGNFTLEVTADNPRLQDQPSSSVFC